MGGKDGKTDLLGLTFAEAEEFFTGLGHPCYRARQVFEWMYSARVRSFADMTNLPLSLRETLAGAARVGALETVARDSPAEGDTVKFLFRLVDGNAVEAVMMRHDYGITACVSSQVGCKMACGFCASGMEGFVRNLLPGEMVAQVTGINETLQRDRRVSRVVLMGSGEPLDNYDASLKFIRIINESRGLNIGMRHITLSTCGIVPGIRRLMREGLPITLSVSLHAPDDELRASLMPVARRYRLSELMNACRDYGETTGRRVTIEYALVDGVNDQDRHARGLAALLKGGLFHVNLIPLNPVEGKGFRRARPDRVKEFYALLENMGIAVTVRREFGTGVDAACGQLRRRVARGGADGV
ncbi:MAG: 23S rRNA (adenine(2503)-C(2))-methyltransferase RlmN [Ignavibacteriales bacterium]